MEMQSVSDCLNIIDDAIVEIYWYFKFRKKNQKYLLEKGQCNFIEDRVALSNVFSQMTSLIKKLITI